MILPGNVQSDDFPLEMNMELLTTSILDLRARVAELEMRNNQLEERLADDGDPTREIFDCYRTESWDKPFGIITFNGCSVDTTTGDPWTGSFTISEPGVYRLTFTGHPVHPATNGDYVPYGYVFIKVDGQVVATAESYYQPSLGTIHK